MSMQFGIKEVLNINVKDFTTGKDLFYADYMLDTSFASKATRLDVRGKQSALLNRNI